LPIDPNAVLPFAVAFERFESVPGRHQKILEANSPLRIRSFVNAASWMLVGSLRE
jgi:hypothetical protein